jgi:uncharacterized membrane protein YhaH (DUF805 family)
VGFVFGIALFVLMLATGVSAALASGGESQAPAGVASAFGGLFILLSAPIAILVFWIGLALEVKRCHDRNYPGVMILISWVPLVGWLWALVDLGFIDGTPGPNQYGPSPKAAMYAAASMQPSVPPAW